MRITHFYRVSGCLNSTGATTSVCMNADRLESLLRLAYGDKPTLNAAVRAASRSPSLLSNRTADGSALDALSWSQAVVDKAASSLSGAYEPLKAAALAAEAEAAANNAAWEQVA